MSVITEQDVKKQFSKKKSGKREFTLLPGQVLTPSAKDYIREHQISVKTKETKVNSCYQNIYGGAMEEKPEYMTHLRGNLLVPKDHKRIALRGAIDSLESEIILLQTELQEEKLIKDLEEVIQFIRRLLRCELTEEAVGEILLQGFTEAEIREHSYHPSKYYGISHFLPTYKHGSVPAKLNRLRTMTREAELCAYRAFKKEYGNAERIDIIKGFNRLSSLFWIMIFKYLAGQYKE